MKHLLSSICLTTPPEEEVNKNESYDRGRYTRLTLPANSIAVRIAHKAAYY
jgi:hypothetical protein